MHLCSHTNIIREERFLVLFIGSLSLFFLRNYIQSILKMLLSITLTIRKSYFVIGKKAKWPLKYGILSTYIINMLISNS